MIAAIYARTIIVMLWCLLALATSASAECAWVLWTSDSPPDRSGGHIYIRREVYSTRDHCVQVMDRLEGASKAKDDGPVMRNSETFLSVPGPNKDTRRAFLCLTETMRPEDQIKIR